MTNLIEQLEARGFIYQCTALEEFKEHCKTPRKVYCGFDPTADSLHIGNLVGIMGLSWFQKAGHTPVAIVGGATGMIGDPGGRNSERQLLTQEIIEKNLLGIKQNLLQVLKGGTHDPLIINNYDWFSKFTMIDFLRDVGKSFRVGPMLAKDSVKRRFESEEGISFTEFSYQLLQGYDFLHLLKHYGVTIQMGGSDQWGNITAGTEYIRKELSAEVFGLTFPLLVKSDGQKFGKSEKGAIWLSPDKLSPYEFYQYLYRTNDSDVVQLLRMLTFLPIDEIRDLERKMISGEVPPNTLQKILAKEVTTIVHGDESLLLALKITEEAAPGASTKLDLNTLERLSQEIPTVELKLSQVGHIRLVDLLPESKLVASRSDAKRMVKNGGVYLNNVKVEAEDKVIFEEDLIEKSLFLLAVGKKNKVVVKVVA